MAKRYTPAVDIWALTPEQRATLQPGQWVTAGPEGPKGRFWGERQVSTVVAWQGNARGRSWVYHAALRAYAKEGQGGQARGF